MILSSSVPSSRDGFELCAVIIGLPASSVRLSCEAGPSSLCTLGSNFIYGRCSWSCGIGSSKCWLLRLEKIVVKRCLSLFSNLLEFVTVFEMLKLSMRW